MAEGVFILLRIKAHADPSGEYFDTAVKRLVEDLKEDLDKFRTRVDDGGDGSVNADIDVIW